MENKNFSWPVTSINREDYEAFCKWYEQFEKVIKSKKIYIWGAGIRGTMFSIFLKKKGISGFSFIDSNEQKKGGYIDEFPIMFSKDLNYAESKGKIIILISTENSIEICKELQSMNYEEGQDYFVVKTNLYEKYVQEFLRSYNQKTLIMGDCEFSTISINDEDDRNLRELLYEKCGYEDIKILAMHGMGLRAHYNMFHGQILNDMKPKQLVLMINFDTLTGKQHLLPRSQHTELLEMLNASVERKSKEFVEYVKLTETRSKKNQLEFFTRQREQSGQLENKARNYIRLNYMYDLDVSTEGIIFLREILKEAIQENIQVIPFVPPVNYKLGIKLFGNEFLTKYDNNVVKIKEVLNEYGIELLDLSYCLEQDMFADPNTPDETANYKGREKVVNILIEAFRKGD